MTLLYPRSCRTCGKNLLANRLYQNFCGNRCKKRLRRLEKKLLRDPK